MNVSSSALTAAAGAVTGVSLNTTTVDPNTISPWVMCSFGGTFISNVCVMVVSSSAASTSAMAFWASFALSVIVLVVSIAGCFWLGFKAPKDLQEFKDKQSQPTKPGCCRRCWSRWSLFSFDEMFQPRWLQVEKKEPWRPTPSGSKGRDMLGRFFAGWYYAEPDHSIGVDALVLLRFAKMSRNIFIVMSTVPFICLLAANVSAYKSISTPTSNATDAESQDQSPTNITIGNLTVEADVAWLLKITPRSNDPVKQLWAYPVVAILINLIVCAFIVYNYQKVRDLRREEIGRLDAHAQKIDRYDHSEYDIAARATRAVLVTGFDEDDFDQLTDKDGSRFHEQCILNRTIRMPVFDEPEPESETSEPPKAPPSENLLQDVATSVSSFLMNRNQDHLRSRQANRKRGYSLPEKVAKYNKEIVGLEAQLDCNFRAIHPEQDPHMVLRHPQMTYCRSVLSFRLWCKPKARKAEQTDDTPKEKRVDKPSKTIKRSVLHHYVPHLVALQEDIAQHKRQIVHPKKGKKQQLWGYAMYDDSAAASAAAFAANKPLTRFDRCREIIPGLSKAGTKIILAPTPGDVLWQNLSIQPASRKCRLNTCKVLFVVLTLVWIFPNTFSTLFLTNLPKLGIVFPSVRKASQAHPGAFAIIEGVLPPLVQMSVYMVLPPLFRGLRRRAGEPTRSSRERAVLRSLFLFFTVNNLIVFSLLSACLKYYATLQTLVRAGQTTRQAWLEVPMCATLKKALLDMSTFWLTYLLQRNIASVVALLQVVRIVCTAVFKVRGIRGLVTPSMERALCMATPVDYAATFNNYLYISAVAFCYSAVQPLALPAAAMYYLVNYIQLKYNVIRVYPDHKYESYGSFWVVSVNRMMVIALLGNCFFTVVIMSVTSHSAAAWGQLGLMSIAVFILVACKAYCHITFETECSYYIKVETKAAADEEARLDNESVIGKLKKSARQIGQDTKAPAFNFAQKPYPLGKRLADFVCCRSGGRHGGVQQPEARDGIRQETIAMLKVLATLSVFKDLRGIVVRDDAKIQREYETFMNNGRDEKGATDFAHLDVLKGQLETLVPGGHAVSETVDMRDVDGDDHWGIEPPKHPKHRSSSFSSRFGGRSWRSSSPAPSYRSSESAPPYSEFEEAPPVPDLPGEAR